MLLSKPWCSLYYRYHCIWSEIFRTYKDCTGVFISKTYFVQHFHLSSQFFLSSFSLTVPRMQHESNRQEFSLVDWMRWSFEKQLGHNNLLQPLCEVPAAVPVQCAPFYLVPWSSYGFADPVSNILDFSKLLMLPKCLLFYAVQLYLIFLHQTAAQGPGTIFLGKAHVHNIAMAIAPKGTNLSTDCKNTMSSVIVILQHNSVYLNITNITLNNHRDLRAPQVQSWPLCFFVLCDCSGST